MAPVYSIAVLLYPGADILDFSGPIEVYSTNPPPGTPRSFKITTFAHQNPVRGENSVLVYVPAATVADVAKDIEQYDILVIPGAVPDLIIKLLATPEGKELTDLIAKFSGLAPRKEAGSRILQSVCSGSLLLAASGILAGRTVTTHHLVYDVLKQVADQAAGGDSKVNIVRKRWVDAGTTEAGVRIINAGGVSSGMDTSLWIVEELVGKKSAEHAAEIMEFERRGQGEAWGVEK